MLGTDGPWSFTILMNLSGHVLLLLLGVLVLDLWKITTIYSETICVVFKGVSVEQSSMVRTDAAVV